MASDDLTPPARRLLDRLQRDGTVSQFDNGAADELIARHMAALVPTTAELEITEIGRAAPRQNEVPRR